MRNEVEAGEKLQKRASGYGAPVLEWLRSISSGVERKTKTQGRYSSATPGEPEDPFSQLFRYLEDRVGSAEVDPFRTRAVP